MSLLRSQRHILSALIKHKDAILPVSGNLILDRRLSWRLSYDLLSQHWDLLHAGKMTYLYWIWALELLQNHMKWWQHQSHAVLNTKSGPVSLTVFPSPLQFKFDENSVSLSTQFYHSDRYKILHMAWHLCCHGMCKNLLLSDSQQWNYSKAKIPSNLTCGQKIVSEMGPSNAYYRIIGVCFLTMI